MRSWVERPAADQMMRRQLAALLDDVRREAIESCATWLETNKKVVGDIYEARARARMLREDMAALTKGSDHGR